MESIVILGIAFVVYFLPSFIAGLRDHRQNGAIFIVNLFLGWTFIGWVIALAWSFTSEATK
jgi:hypothetical protein